MAEWNVAAGDAYSTNAVLRGERPVLLVVHERDGDWQFLDGGAFDADDGVALHAVHVFDQHPELCMLAGLPIGWAAERASEESSWRRYEWVDEHVDGEA